MAAPSTFTPEEDAIILANPKNTSVETNAMLVTAGFAERDARQISDRRYYLRKHAPTSTPKRSRLGALDTQRVKLETQIAKLEHQLVIIKQERNGILEAIRTETNTLTRSIPKPPTGTNTNTPAEQL